MELRAGDGRVVELAEITDLGDDVADLVVLLDGLEESFVGHINAEVVVQFVEHMHLQRSGEVFYAVLILLEGHIGERDEEFLILNEVGQLAKVLLEAAGAGAGLGAELGVDEVVAAFESALQKAARIVAHAAGHVVGRHIGRGAARRTKAYAEAAGQIEKDFRHKVASIAEGIFAFFFCLTYKRVIGLLQQVIIEDDIFQITHGASSVDTLLFFGGVLARLLEVKLAHTFHLIADLAQTARVAVGGDAV